ncbi:MAG: MBL fold metallo-hydrolase [Simkaniaceae bacterium]
MVRFCPLASGSKGNAIFLSTEKTKILFDCGLSAKQLEVRLNSIGESLSEIEAILISHEHTDHIRAVEIVSKQYQIPILANSETAKAILAQVRVEPLFKIFSTGETFHFKDLEIHPFSIQHDTLDPVAFTVKTCGYKIGICTDLGFATSLVENHLRGCDVLYLESNHEPSMVHASARPMVYKQRVLGRQGHLSNEAAAELLQKVAHEKLLKVYLAHLSEECNHPEVALKKAKEALSKAEISVEIAHQVKCSSLLELFLRV